MGCSNHGLRRTSIALLAAAGMNSHMIAKTTKKTAASIANYIDAGAADYDLKHTVLSAPFHKRISTPEQDNPPFPPPSRFSRILFHFLLFHHTNELCIRETRRPWTQTYPSALLLFHHTNELCIGETRKPWTQTYPSALLL
jgi:hypothetical protein